MLNIRNVNGEGELMEQPPNPVGYWHQWADERFAYPPPKVDPGAFGGQR